MESVSQNRASCDDGINTAGLQWRVMAQVSLGEVLSSPNARAYSAINSKRVDLLIVSRSGDPIAAIEYQGHGHYQGTAAARDAVKKEALRKAGVRYIEVTPESGTEEMVRVISRIAQVEHKIRGGGGRLKKFLPQQFPARQCPNFATNCEGVFGTGEDLLGNAQRPPIPITEPDLQG